MPRQPRIILTIFLAVVLAMTPMLSYAAPQEKYATTAFDILPIIDSDNRTTQAERFYEFICRDLKYTSVRSLYGKSGRWLAFIDIFETFEKGKSSGYALQQGTVQYGMHRLPLGTENTTLELGENTAILPFEKTGVFRFPSMLKLDESAIDGIGSVNVTVWGNTLTIPLIEESPSEDIPSFKEALEAMAPTFVLYARKNEVPSVHASYMRLKSYLIDSSAMTRTFKWELYMLHGNKYPCNATIIRYDCETKKTSIIFREIKEYI